MGTEIEDEFSHPLFLYISHRNHCPHAEAQRAQSSRRELYYFPLIMIFCPAEIAEIAEIFSVSFPFYSVSSVLKNLRQSLRDSDLTIVFLPRRLGKTQASSVLLSLLCRLASPSSSSSLDRVYTSITLFSLVRRFRFFSVSSVIELYSRQSL